MLNEVRSQASAPVLRADPAASPSWVPSVAGALAVAIGLLNIVSGVTPELRDRLRTLRLYLPGALSDTATSATVVAGVLLIMLGHGLRRRKRRAWLASLLLLAASVALHLTKGLDYEEASVAGLLLVTGLPLGRHFYAASDPRNRWRSLNAVVGLVVASYAIGLALLAARHGSIVGSPSLWSKLREVTLGLGSFDGPLRFTSPRTADEVGGILFGLGLLMAATVLYLLLRPDEPAGRLTPADEEAMRSLLARHGGRDSLGYFALRRDKSVVFSPSGKAAISYRVHSGVMLASGDPVGDPEAWPGAIAAFLAEANRHAWLPAVTGCSELGGQVWVRETGMHALELGDEAIVKPESFCLDGRAMRNVRQMVSRVDRAGYVCQVRRTHNLDPDEIREIRREAAAWRGAEVERGFSMALGRFGEPDDGDCVAVTAHKDGQLRALLHFVPWGRDGLSLELMRRDRSADPGLNEFMIVRTLQAADWLGVQRLSLNFAVFRSAFERGERLGAGPALRAWRRILLFASRWYQIESLYRYNAKFQPEWQPRFICYPSAASLARVALATLEAEAFLVWPRLPWKRKCAG
jgi:lysyl-tRNA synthetase class 2